MRVDSGRTVKRVLLLTLLAAVPARAVAQDSIPDFVAIMRARPDSGRSIGLAKLTRPELKALNGFMAEMYEAAWNRARSSMPSGISSPPTSSTATGLPPRPPVPNIPGARATLPQPAISAMPAPAAGAHPPFGSATYRGYLTKADDVSDEILKLRNGAVVEVLGGSIGYVSSSRTVLLMTAGASCKVWIESKRLYRCSLVRAPYSQQYQSVVLASITEVKGNGSILVIDDGSLFEVNGAYTYLTTIWLPTSDIAILDDSQIVNLEESDEPVDVQRVR